MIRIVNPRVEYMKNPLGIDVLRPLITWNIQGSNQKAFRVQLIGEFGMIYDSDMIWSKKMQFRIPFDMQWRDHVEVHFSVYGVSNSTDAVSFNFEMALGAQNFVAQWINPENYVIDKKIRYSPSVLRRNFILDSYSNDSKSRLYITSQGIYTVFINGVRLDSVLAPGTFQSNKRQLYQTYDIAEYLLLGENEIIVVLLDGWYRGSMGNTAETYRFGDKLALLCQLEISNKVILISDTSWKASQSGPVRFSDLMQGEVFDANLALAEIKDWHNVTKSDDTLQDLRCSNMPLVKEKERFKGTIITTPKGEKIYDFGQNIAGYIELSFVCDGLKDYVFEFGEALDKYGNFTITNFQNPKKTVYQKIQYRSKQGENQYKPFGTYMGFRYMKVSDTTNLENMTVEAIAIYTDLDIVGSIETGNSRVNQLILNALWSLKGNFVDIPTDCPTREKDGFTGDFQAYIHTAMYFTDCYGFARRWLEELVASQYEDGCLPMIAPNGREKFSFDGAGGWCDAITIVTERIAKRYNDYESVKHIYPAMKQWVDYSLNRAYTKTRLYNLRNPYRKYLLDTGMHWGEWLEPQAKTICDMSHIALFGELEVATAFLIASYFS